MSLVRCQNGYHPGRHLKTPKCVNPKSDSVGEHILSWLEGKLNPKQGSPHTLQCKTCKNSLIEIQGICTYCGARP
jgi:hypothetical protein